jgi:DNA-binding beta-propeller fold protein YncE
MIVRTSNKTGSAHPIVGRGEHVYEVIHDWGELPPEIQYGNTHGVCEDSQGRIYVHHTVHKGSQSHDTMVVFDADGKFVASWGPQFMGGAHGLHIHNECGEDFLYLCDKNRGMVVKATRKGEEVWTIGYPEQSDAYQTDATGQRPKYSPTNLAIAPNGAIYVGDGYGSSYINQYDSKGKYVCTFGGKGDEAGKLSCPHGIIVDTRHAGDPILTVADRGNNRIQRFTLEGKHIDFVAGTKMPCHFGCSTNGDMVVPDLAARVTLMDRDNKIIAHLGDDSASEWQKTRTMSRDQFTPGKFIAPHGACFDHAGNIFVVEWVEVGRVTKLRKL